MDLLPVELVRLIYQYCDPPSVRALRLTSVRLADVGYEFLLPPHFTAVEWRDDITRLRSIAGHDRLRGSIRSITFNFSRVNEYNARHAAFLDQWFQLDREDHRAMLEDAWTQYHDLEKRGRRLPPFHSRSAAVEEAFRLLPNLSDLEVTFTRCPYPVPFLDDVFRVPGCRKRDREQARRAVNAVVSAIGHLGAPLASLAIDHLPLEVLRHAGDRRHWFDCAARSFAPLTRLSLVLDPASGLLPRSRSCAVNGLGRVLQHCPNLSRLSLAFHPYHAPREKFPLSFRAMFGGGGQPPEEKEKEKEREREEDGGGKEEENEGSDGDGDGGARQPGRRSCFVFRRLTDLKLEGVSCAEDDLRGFLLRHAATLARLRLGGRGLARPREPSVGGVHLHEGSFRGLFASLRGRLPRLERFHMEGDAEAGHFLTGGGGRLREAYQFRAVTDDEWMPIRGDGDGDDDDDDNDDDDDDVVDGGGRHGVGGACGEGHGRHGSGHDGRRNGEVGASSSGGGARRRRSSPSSLCVETVDCLELERYLVHGGEYPRLAAQVGA